MQAVYCEIRIPQELITKGEFYKFLWKKINKKRHGSVSSIFVHEKVGQVFLN